MSLLFSGERHSHHDPEETIAKIRQAMRKTPPKKVTARSPGDQAIATKLAMGGQRELSRAADQAEHSKKYPPADYPNKPNPFRREVFYSADEQVRHAAFKKWHKENPNRDHSENPHRFLD